MKRTLLALVALLFVALPAWAIPPFPPQNIDGKCDESVFGSSIGTGLLLDSTTLKVSSILQKYHGVDPSANVLTLLGAANFSAFRTSLSLVPGSDVQAYNALLTDIAGLSLSTGDMIYYDGTHIVKISAGTENYFLKMGATIPGWSNTLTGTFGGFTASMAVVSDGSGNLASDANVSATELGYLDNVTGAIQTQLNGKQATVTEGSLADSVIVSADIKDDTIAPADLDYTIETEYLPIAYAIDGASAPDTLATVTSDTDKVDARTFAGDADEDVLFTWKVPADLDATSGIKFRVLCVITASTAPSSETWQFELQGFSLGDGDALDGTLGTAQTSNSGSRSDAQYDLVHTAWSSAMTSTHITDLAAGETVIFKFYRDVDDTDDYEQPVGVVGVELKYKREHDSTF